MFISVRRLCTITVEHRKLQEGLWRVKTRQVFWIFLGMLGGNPHNPHHFQNYSNRFHPCMYCGQIFTGANRRLITYYKMISGESIKITTEKKIKFSYDNIQQNPLLLNFIQHTFAGQKIICFDSPTRQPAELGIVAWNLQCSNSRDFTSQIFTALTESMLNKPNEISLPKNQYNKLAVKWISFVSTTSFGLHYSGLVYFVIYCIFICCI